MRVIREILIDKKKYLKDIRDDMGEAKHPAHASIDRQYEIEKGRPLSRPFTGGPRKTKKFKENIKRDRVNIIAEIKKASPSRGWINRDLDVKQAAATYDRYHDFICGISVLTESLYFKGCPQDLDLARRSTSLPLLRKDFIIDVRQIYESAAFGADCILLICSLLGYKKLKILHDTAIALGMDVLVEIHDTYELEKALKLDAGLIGINNRDLKEMKVKNGKIFEILDYTGRRDLEGKILVCESGITDVDYIEELYQRKVNTFLVGSYFMGSSDLVGTLDDFRYRLEKKNLIGGPEGGGN